MEERFREKGPAPRAAPGTGGGRGVRRLSRVRRTRPHACVALRALALLLVAASPGAAQAPAGGAPSGEDLPVVERVLDNGLRLLVLPREGAPTVSFVARYDVGSVNEALGHTGIAHLLEHMLFKGTTTIGTRNVDAERALFGVLDAVNDSLVAARARPAVDSATIAALEARLDALEDSARAYVVSSEFDRILSRNGARGLNASTTVEATTYYVQLPANRAKLWFVLEADRLLNPVFREFYTERDVVAEERRMRIETDPGGLLYTSLLAAAFRVHPYGVPVIGHMSDIRNLSRSQVAAYYRDYYGPNNAIVAVVGDVDPDSVVAWAEAYLGPIPRGREPPPVLAVEPPQRGERRVEVVYDAEPQLLIGWHVPSALHEDAPALAMLSAVLTGGRTSRLYRRLVLEEKLAQGVSASLGPGARYPRLFMIGATPGAGKTMAELERAIYEEVARLRRDPPTDAELRRIRNRLEAGAVFRLQSSFGLAMQLVESAALWGDWRQTFREIERYRAVDAADIVRVAEKYLTRENRTVATLVRQKAKEGAL
ncbi:MAG TPA: pitrilysin family protein [Longimicrobiales bacterium]